MQNIAKKDEQMQQTTMRNGISLVEMMIAIILFGVISIIGYKYYTNFMNTSLSGQKARVAAVVDQARQLSNGYDVYKAQFGVAPTSEQNLTAANAMILTEIPEGMEAITGSTTNTWSLSTTAEVDGDTDNDDHAFVYPVDTGVDADDLQYCNIVNNLADSSRDLNSTTVPTNENNAYTAGLETFFCIDSAGDGTGTTEIMFVKALN